MGFGDDAINKHIYAKNLTLLFSRKPDMDGTIYKLCICDLSDADYFGALHHLSTGPIWYEKFKPASHS